MKLRLLTAKKYLEISFDYHLDQDTPDGIANEMRADLGLHEGSVNGIKAEIERIIDKINEKVDLTCGSIRNSIKEAIRPEI